MREFLNKIGDALKFNAKPISTPPNSSSIVGRKPQVKIPFDAAFKEKFEHFKGQWLCDENGVIYVLNYYHIKDGFVISLDFNVAVEEESRPQTVTVTGDLLQLYLDNDWRVLQVWMDRQSRIKKSLRVFKFKIEKIAGFKTKKERRAGNV